MTITICPIQTERQTQSSSTFLTLSSICSSKSLPFDRSSLSDLHNNVISIVLQSTVFKVQLKQSTVIAKVSTTESIWLLLTALAGNVMRSVVSVCPSVSFQLSILSFEPTLIFPRVWVTTIARVDSKSVIDQGQCKNACATRVSTAASYEY